MLLDLLLDCKIPGCEAVRLIPIHSRGVNFQLSCQHLESQGPRGTGNLSSIQAEQTGRWWIMVDYANRSPGLFSIRLLVKLQGTRILVWFVQVSGLSAAGGSQNCRKYCTYGPATFQRVLTRQVIGLQPMSLLVRD